MIPQPYEWQIIDEDNGLIMPWFTHDSLAAMKKIKFTDDIIFSFGAGYGDAWLAKKCKKLYVVERFEEWIIKAADVCMDNGINNIEYFHRPCNDSSGNEEIYCKIPDGISPEVIISDDAYRTEVVEMAINHFKNKQGGGIFIADNWWQDMVWKSEKAVEMLEPFNKKIYPQKNHTDHQGECWKTLIAYIK